MKNKKFKIIMSVFVLYILYGALSHEYQRFLLRQEGVLIKAVVSGSRKVGSKGDIRSEYYFIWKGEIHEGYFLGYGNEIEDSISIFFAKSNPDISRISTDIGIFGL